MPPCRFAKPAYGRTPYSRTAHHSHDAKSGTPPPPRADCTQRKRPPWGCCEADLRQYVNISRIKSKRGVGRAPRAIAIAVAATGQSAVGRAAREQRVH